MARPQKEIQQRQSRVLPPIRCTDEQRAAIQKRAAKAGLTLSEYVRSMALQGRITVHESKADFEMISELHKIGVNINQQTKMLHTHAQLPAALPPLWDKLSSLLDDIIESL